MNSRGRPSLAHGLAEKCSLLGIAFDQVNASARHIRERAGDRKARKAATSSEVDPYWRIRLSGLRGKVQQLQRVCDMANPYGSDRRGCDQVDLALPGQQ